MNVKFFDWDYLHLTALMKETYFRLTIFLFFTALSNLYVALYHGCHLETRCRVVKVKKDLHQGVWKVTAEKRAIKGHIGVKLILKARIKGQ